jgi:stage II sporulation protein D
MRVSIAAMVAALALPATATAGTVFLLDGRGWGHGVGMSQWGAEGYARHGYSYRRILEHYYPGTRLGISTPRPVRVLLLQAQDRVRIGSTAPFLLVDAKGRKLHLPARSVVLSRRFMLRHRHLAQPVRFEPGAQPLQVSFAGYRGDVVVKAKPDGLMVVNELPLDRYLRGVVPWEVPRGWHPATYAAQAVAARSYTLATVHPGQDFDLFPDERSQMYGGVRAERLETNLAIGSTTGQVLTWRDRIVPAYYFSSSGGKTSSVHDAWPRSVQVPYLVSVADPYDYISPHHVWPTSVLTAVRVARLLHLRRVEDAVVVRNSSGRARALRVRTARGWRAFSGQQVRTLFKLGSTDFELRAMSLEPPAATALFGTHVAVHGWVRGLGKARLQELTAAGWVTVGRIHASPLGRFALTLHAIRSAQLRLAYNSLAGDTVALHVAPRLRLHADGTRLHVVVSPRLPLLVQRLTRSAWRPVARATGSFDRALRPGSYRVSVAGSVGYAAAVSQPVGLRASHRLTAGK